jgi:hypothetical protein
MGAVVVLAIGAWLVFLLARACGGAGCAGVGTGLAARPAGAPAASPGGTTALSACCSRSAGTGWIAGNVRAVPSRPGPGVACPSPARELPGPDDPRVRDGRIREVLVPFVDGTLRSCHVQGWFQYSGGWLILLQWGVSGRPRYGWYVYSPDRVVTALAI